MTKLAIITDLKKLSAAIKANSSAHAKVDTQWQLLAFSAIAAFEAHGNVFYINQVYKAIGKGARHKAMVLYFLTFGGVKANPGNEETPFVKDSDKKPNMAEAETTMWYDMAPSPKPDDVVDYLALIMKVLKKSPKEGQTVAHSDFREAVSKLAQEYAEKEQAELEAAGSGDDTLSGIAAATAQK